MRTTKIGVQSPSIEVENCVSPGKLIFDSGIGEFLEKAGIFLFPWQRYILDKWLRRGVDGWDFSSIGLSVPRRNGKSEIVIAFILVKTCLFDEKTCYTSYHKQSMTSIFNRLRELIGAEDSCGLFLRSFFDVPNKKGQYYFGPGILTGAGFEAIVSKKGARCDFLTRAGGAGRGSGFDNLIFDEAQELTADQLQALLPTADSSSPQVMYIGTPETIQSESRIFSNLRESIIDHVSSSSYWAEWSVSKMTNKTNRAMWYKTNPSLGLKSIGGRGGMTEKTIEKNLGMNDESFSTEILGYWSRKAVGGLFDVATWDALERDEPEPTTTEKIALGIKFDINGESFSVCIASADNDRNTFVQLLCSGSTTGPVSDNVQDGYGPSVYVDWKDWFSQVLIPIIKSKKCVSVIIDGIANVSEVKVLLSSYRLWDVNKASSKQGKIQIAKTSDQVFASSLFVNSVHNEEVSHDGDLEVQRLIIDAGKRTIRSIPGGYGFQSNSGNLTMSILECIALAFYGVSLNAIKKQPLNTTIKTKKPDWVFSTQSALY